MLSRPVGRRGPWVAFTSFREIISVVGRTRVGVRLFFGTNGGVVQVKYTNQVFSFLGKAGIDDTCFDGRSFAGSPSSPEDAAVMRVFLLPDQIKRDKGGWWMPWQQEAMKDAASCDKPRVGACRL